MSTAVGPPRRCICGAASSGPLGATAYWIGRIKPAVSYLQTDPIQFGQSDRLRWCILRRQDSGPDRFRYQKRPLFGHCPSFVSSCSRNIFDLRWRVSSVRLNSISLTKLQLWWLVWGPRGSSAGPWWQQCPSLSEAHLRGGQGETVTWVDCHSLRREILDFKTYWCAPVILHR